VESKTDWNYLSRRSSNLGYKSRNRFDRWRPSWWQHDSDFSGNGSRTLYSTNSLKEKYCAYF